MKKIHITTKFTGVTQNAVGSVLSIAAAFASGGKSLRAEKDRESPNKYHLYPAANDWWALVDVSQDGLTATVLIRSRYKQECADLLMDAICQTFNYSFV